MGCIDCVMSAGCVVLPKSEIAAQPAFTFSGVSACASL